MTRERGVYAFPVIGTRTKEQTEQGMTTDDGGGVASKSFERSCERREEEVRREL